MSNRCVNHCRSTALRFSVTQSPSKDFRPFQVLTIRCSEPGNRVVFAFARTRLSSTSEHENSRAIGNRDDGNRGRDCPRCVAREFGCVQGTILQRPSPKYIPSWQL